MQKFLILGATLALSTACVLPVTQALNIGGEAQAMRDGERKRAGNRSGRRNGEGARTRKRQDRDATATRQRREAGNRTRRQTARVAQPEPKAKPARHRASRVTRPRFEPRLSRFRDRKSRFERRRPAPRFRRALRRDRFCVRRGRIIRRLHRQGWDVLAFHRAGPRYNAQVRSRRGHRYAMSLDACSGQVLAQHSLEKRRRRGVKKVLRKIRKSFRKIF